MTEPIRSRASSLSPTYDPDSDLVGMCEAEGPNASTLPAPPVSSSSEEPLPEASSVPQLVASVNEPPTTLPPTRSVAPSPTANNNAQRTSDLTGVKPYGSAGLTAAADSAYAAAALLKGHDASGADIELLSASGQLGAQSEVQFGLQRIAGASGLLAGSVEAFSLRANVGIHNDDGSTGFNIGAGAAALGFEGTFGGATSVTYGLSAGPSVGGSIGARDSDADGQTEVCARVSVGPATFGLCVENPL